MKITKSYSIKLDDASIENVKKDIFCKVINFDQNRDDLMTMPYEKHLDLAVVYYIHKEDEEGVFTCFVTNEVMEKLRLTEDEVKTIAWNNTLLTRKAIMKPLSEVVGMDDGDTSLYILSNDSMCYGAVTVFYPRLLELIAEELNEDLCVIPSSIHECLIMTASWDEDLSTVKQVVKKINDEIVDEADVLSYNVYRYSKAQRSLIIDNR